MAEDTDKGDGRGKAGRLPEQNKQPGAERLPPVPRPPRPGLRAARPPLWLGWLRPGMRVTVAVSGGADSVALLRALLDEHGGPLRPGSGGRLGLILSVAHMHHGIRGQAADQDTAFVQTLAGELGLALFRKDVDTPAFAQAKRIGLEEAARTLRYEWFWELLASGELDAVVTAHTLNDQAETVLHKLLRGAWTEGLSGIHPLLDSDQVARSTLSPARGTAAVHPGGAVSAGLRGGRILRPLLHATHSQIVDWLTAIGQPWREDETNADQSYTRNRIRHQLLPQLATFNPRIANQLAQTATIAREEEAYWQQEVSRLLPGLLLPGRAVRGGGRATSTRPGDRSLAIEVERLRGLHPALVRRLLRGAARQLGVSLDFEQSARLVALVEGSGTLNPRREELTAQLRAERTPRELRLLFCEKGVQAGAATAPAGVEIPVPGEGEGFGWRLHCSPAHGSAPLSEKALLRAAAPADRVLLRYSRGTPKRVKEVLERMGVPADDRVAWPVLTFRGEIVWMQGAVLEPSAISELLLIAAEPLA